MVYETSGMVLDRIFFLRPSLFFFFFLAEDRPQWSTSSVRMTHFCSLVSTHTLDDEPMVYITIGGDEPS